MQPPVKYLTQTNMGDSVRHIFQHFSLLQLSHLGFLLLGSGNFVANGCIARGRFDSIFYRCGSGSKRITS